MKYCHNCRTYLPEDFAFCIRCGSSFDVKYCRKLHSNPVTAEYCRVCGSSDLSTPHKRPWGIGVGLSIAAVLGVLLAIGTVWSIVHSVQEYDLISSGEILLMLLGGASLTVIWTWLTRR